MIAIYRSLLHLYPAAYREEYADEMMTVFDEVEAEMETRVRWRERYPWLAKPEDCCAGQCERTCEVFLVHMAVRHFHHFHEGGRRCVPNSGFQKRRLR